MIRALALLANMALLACMAYPVAAQTTDPAVLIDQIKSRQAAGENPAQLAQELGAQLANPPASADWFAPLLLHATLLTEAGEAQASLTALTQAEGFYFTVPDADPMFLDWIHILQGLRLADLGHYDLAADQLTPLLPSVLALFGQSDHDALARTIPQWRAVMLVADPERAFAQLGQAVTAYQAGNPTQAETLARALVLPPESLGEDTVALLVTAGAQSLLALVANGRANADMARQLSAQAVSLITTAPSDGALALRPLPPAPEFTDLALSILYTAAILALDADQTPHAMALIAAMTPVSHSPAQQAQLLSLQMILAGDSGDVADMLRIARERQTVLQSDPTTDLTVLASVAFEVDLLAAFYDLKNGKAVDITSLSAKAGNNSPLQATLFTELLVTIGRQYLSPAQIQELAGQAIAQRDKTTPALAQSETARDTYLRAGRDLTESWLNAAFAQTRTDINDLPPLQITCSDDTAQAFCVIWSTQ